MADFLIELDTKFGFKFYKFNNFAYTKSGGIVNFYKIYNKIVKKCKNLFVIRRLSMILYN